MGINSLAVAPWKFWVSAVPHGPAVHVSGRPKLLLLLLLSIGSCVGHVTSCIRCDQWIHQNSPPSWDGLIWWFTHIYNLIEYWTWLDDLRWSQMISDDLRWSRCGSIASAPILRWCHLADRYVRDVWDVQGRCSPTPADVEKQLQQDGSETGHVGHVLESDGIGPFRRFDISSDLFWDVLGFLKMVRSVGVFGVFVQHMLM